MEGGDLKTRNRRYRGGDLATSNCQHGCFIGSLGSMFGLGPAELQKQMLVQRGGFPWALAAGLSMLPMLMERRPRETIANQMKATPSERAQG